MDQISAVAEHVQRALSASPHFPTRSLEVEDTEGRVVLRGTVGSYFQKQMAQEAARRVDGVHEIENQLEVAWR